MTLAEFIAINRARLAKPQPGMSFDLACLVAAVPVMLEIIEVQDAALTQIDCALRCPAAEYVPAIPEAWSQIDMAQEEVDKLIAVAE